MEHHSILQLNTSREYFDEVHLSVIDGISENIAYLLQKDKYGSINEAGTTKLGYYVVKCVSRDINTTVVKNKYPVK